MTGFIVCRCDKGHEGKKIIHAGRCRFAIVVSDGHYIAANGKRRQRQRWISFVASKDANTIKKAEAEAQVKLAEIVTAQSAGELVRPTTDTTLIDHMRAWFKSTAGEYRPATFAAYRNAIEKHIASAPIALMKLSDVKLFDVEHYLKTVKGGRAMRKMHRAVLSKAFSEAVRHGVLKTSPTVGAKLPKRKHDDVAHDARLNCWSVDEALTFLRTVDADGDAQMGAFVHLGLDTGARKMELAGLKWSDIDFDARTVKIERQLDRAGREPSFGPTKTKRERVVEITGQTINRLRAHRREQAALKMANRTTYADFDLVFAREERDRRPGTRLGEPIETLSEYRFAKLVEKAKVRMVSAHAMRHTLATTLLSAGVALNDVAGRLGHGNPTITLSTYAHCLKANQRQTADRVGELLAVGS